MQVLAIVNLHLSLGKKIFEELQLMIVLIIEWTYYFLWLINQLLSPWIVKKYWTMPVTICQCEIFRYLFFVLPEERRKSTNPHIGEAGTHRTCRINFFQFLLKMTSSNCQNSWLFCSRLIVSALILALVYLSTEIVLHCEECMIMGLERLIFRNCCCFSVLSAT